MRKNSYPTTIFLSLIMLSTTLPAKMAQALEVPLRLELAPAGYTDKGSIGLTTAIIPGFVPGGQYPLDCELVYEFKFGFGYLPLTAGNAANGFDPTVGQSDLQFSFAPGARYIYKISAIQPMISINTGWYPIFSYQNSPSLGLINNFISAILGIELQLGLQYTIANKWSVAVTAGDNINLHFAGSTGVTNVWKAALLLGYKFGDND